MSLFAHFGSCAQDVLKLSSPSGRTEIQISATDTLRYSVFVNGRAVMDNCRAALFTDAGNPGVAPAVTGTSRRESRENIINPVPYKRSVIPDHFNELTIRLGRRFSIVFRAYDDGIAYRFTSAVRDSITVRNELAIFRPVENDTVFFPEVQKREGLDIFHTSFEEPYKRVAIEDIGQDNVAFTPLLIRGDVNTVITESDLIDYPGMFVRGTGRRALHGTFAGYPDREEVFGDEFRQPMVVRRRDFIARTAGTRSFPWRVVLIAEKDAALLMNDLVYRLATPATGDFSWVKPGMSTEEWICGINLHGVDFKSGLNTASYKYYIDFAKEAGMQYVMLDAGWSDANDLFNIRPEMDLQEIATYAQERNIGLIFWTLSMTLERQLDRALDMIAGLNGKVIMTDFMDRDDQKTLRFYQRVAEAAAKRKLMVMFHGAFKNAGFERTWPNAVAREGVLGSEYNIWSDKATPEHDLILPFTRMTAGPMDYEPGFMVNVNRQSFRPIADMLMSMGTRCHQLAMFVVYESPLQLFSGNPSDAKEEIPYMRFLASIPTTWDETVVVDARVADYVLMARRKGSAWYVAAMTDWSAREFQVPLSFLGDGRFKAEVCEDGVNADRYGSDYRMSTMEVASSGALKVSMAPGGGYVAKIVPLNE